MAGAMVKLLRWTVFGVLISLLPLIYSYMNLAIKSQPATWAKILGSGELLIVVWALCAGAVGELFGSSSNLQVPKIVSGGLTLVVLIFSALLFAGVAEAKASGAKIDEAHLVWTSCLLLFFGVTSCASCVALSEM